MNKEIKELMEKVSTFQKPSINSPNYIKVHKEYIELEDRLDALVYAFFCMSGKGKLENGRYFK